MSPPPYMRLYWGDYFRDTPHLTRAAQHGAYMLLLGALWNSGGKLASDDKTLAAKALLTPAEWLAMKPLILPFFRIVRGKLTQKRLGMELAKYESKIGKLKEAGKAGSLVTNGKRSTFGAANAEKKSGKSRHNQNQKEGIEGSNEPSSLFPRDAPEARLDGASGLRVVEGGISEREAWAAGLARAELDLPHFAQTDPDFASDIAEFIAVATEKLSELERVA